MYNQEISLLPNIILFSVIELFCVALNLISIAILLYIKTLHRPSNYLIVSALLGALLQSLILAPHFMLNQVGQIYSVKNLTWINCFVYSVSKDIMKISLMFVSLCQLGSIRYPYEYLELVTRKMVILITSIMWIVILIINIIPFCLSASRAITSYSTPYNRDQTAYQSRPGSRFNHACKPSQYWQITTVFLFDLIPSIVITSSYIIIWKTALRINKKDKTLKKRIKKIQSEDENFQENQNLLNGGDNNTREDDEGESSYREIPFTTEENIEFLNSGHEQKYADEKARSSCNLIPSLCKLKATKTTILLLSTYLICWGPIDTIEMMNAFRYLLHWDVYSDNYPFIQDLSFSAPVLLPLVYCWRSKQFRMKVNQLIFRRPYRLVQESLAEIPEIVLAQYTALTRETRHKAASFISNVSSLLSN